jgi:Spy/CpxP family protein refolding chaperone
MTHRPLIALTLVMACALPAVLHAAPAQTPSTPPAAPMISASSATAAQTVAELRAETKAIQARIKELRAAQQIDKAVAQRDKARAALAALLAKEATK